MCVGINGPGDLSLSPFDLETGILVASKVGNVHSEFEHARTLGSRVIRYVRDTACILCVITRAQLLPRMADRTRAVKTTLFTSALRRIFSNR